MGTISTCMSRYDNLPQSLEDEPLEVQTIYPDDSLSWSEAQNQKIQSVIEQMNNNENNIDILGLTHNDLDGYACEVALREAFPQRNIACVSLTNSGPNSIENIGKDIARLLDVDTEIFIMDLSPDNKNAEEFINPFEKFEVTFVDHHVLDEEDRNTLEQNDVRIYHDTDRCASKIMYDEFVDSSRLEKFFTIVQDHDLWIKDEKEKSDNLSDIAEYTEKSVFVSKVLEEGALVLQSQIGLEKIKTAKEIRKKEKELALSRTTYSTINGYDIAISYGDYNPNPIGEFLFTEKDVDIFVLLYPTGSASIRTREDLPVAEEIASNLGGGGHENAAGCSLDIVGSKVNNTTYWATMGDIGREHMKEVIRNSL